MSTVFDLAYARQRNMSDWTLRSLTPIKYWDKTKYVPSQDPRCLLWVLDDVSSCPYEDGDMKFCTLTVIDRGRLYPPWTEKGPVPRYRLFDPEQRYVLKVSDADDGEWIKYTPQYPHEEVEFLLNKQPVGRSDLQSVFK